MAENTADTGKDIRKKPSRKLRYGQRVVIAVIICCMLTLGCIVAGLRIFTMRPYAISLNGKEICYLEDIEGANKVLNDLAGGFIPEDSDLKLIKSDGGLEIVKAGHVAFDRAQLLSPKEAAERVREEISKEGQEKPVEITTVSTRVETERFTPEPEYKKDETMLAGESEVLDAGKKGKKELLVSYTCVNGEVKSKDVIKSKVLDEGRSKVIKKGVLGLPSGEDWETYEGDPVFENGADLVTTSMNYLGAPYKYGGTSLETGIDCVAFVVQMYKKYGIKLPSSHSGLQHIGTGVSLDKAQKGDIICYAKHVGIYVGDGQMIEATSKHGVRVGKVNASRLVAVRRVVGGN